MLGCVVALLWTIPSEARASTGFIMGWNVGAGLYLLLSAWMMSRSTAAQMHRRALAQDAGQWVVLGLAVVAALVCIAAIVAELAVVKDLKGAARYSHSALAAVTIIIAWAFTHLMFAQHYAHDYYAERAAGRSGGLDFPGEDDDSLGYGDFVYLAFIIGTSGQTADVSFTSGLMRRVGTVHCVLAYVFNATVLAMTINIGASLF